MRPILRPDVSTSVPRTTVRSRSVCLAALTLILSSAGARSSHGVDVNTAKADIVWNIAKFVTWPADAMGPTTSPIVVTIVGEDELAIALASQLSTRSVNGRAVFVRFARRAQDVRGSHVVYVASSESAHIDAVLAELRGKPALTVADASGFVQRGGMVNFTQEAGRTRFQIHVGHAEAVGLKVSSRLLSLAQVVGEDP